MAQEYIEQILARVYDGLGNLGEWFYFGRIKVEANSLEEAIKAGEDKTRKELNKLGNAPKKPIVLVDKVLDTNEKLLYLTAWDETGPLAGVVC